MNAKQFFTKHDVTSKDIIAPTITVVAVLVAGWLLLTPFTTELVEVATDSGTAEFEKSIAAVDAFQANLIVAVAVIVAVVLALLWAADKIVAHIKPRTLVAGGLVLVVASIAVWEFFLHDVVTGIEYSQAAWRALGAVVIIIAGYVLNWTYRHKTMMVK